MYFRENVEMTGGGGGLPPCHFERGGMSIWMVSVCSIDTLSPEIPCHHAARTIEEGDFFPAPPKKSYLIMCISYMN
ncbi:hypothetical protein [uncultured Dialister sp.]|uniref:hypothetical protein n=1 Tax=uncultured Dialister sp. TaxID=278064 RepID=UPI0026DB2D80|nr:hypothetical protein [uncultured Dialister sp.]